jgi:hypothetical protein
MLLEIMSEGWSYLERTQRDLAGTVAVLQLDDTEILRFHTANLLFKEMLRQISNERIRLGDLNETTTSPAWDTRNEKCFRFLYRSLDNFGSFVQTYQDIIFQLPADDCIRSLQSHLRGAETLVRKLIRPGLPKVKSLYWDCNSESDCSADDHVHTADHLVWPSREAALKMPIGTEPFIEWRDFKYNTISVPRVSFGSFSYAIEAVRESLAYEYNASVDLYSRAISNGSMEVVKVLLNEWKFLEALAAIGFELSEALRADSEFYELGIILPGGSQIFFPSSTQREEVRNVYIEMIEDLSDKVLPFKFHRVNVIEASKEQGNKQTVEFLDLPPEVRSMIYELVLENDTNRRRDRTPAQQPTLALTCRAVNKEIMSLFFRRYGWIVKM